MSDELPEGWSVVPLGRITTKIGSGATPRGGSASYVTAGIPLVRSQNVYFDAFRDKGLVFLNQEQASALDGVRVEEGDVLLNITGASIGRACVAPPRMHGARVNQHVAIIRPRQSTVDPVLLAMYLESPAIQIRINTEEYGVTRQALTKGWIEELEVPIPPQPEQRRIVEKVEALLEQVNRAKGRLERVPLILKRFRRAVLDAACAGFISSMEEDGDLPAAWRETALEDLAEPGGILDGARDHGSQTAVAQNLRTVDYTNSGVRVIRLENLAHLRFVEEKRTFISEAKYAGLVQNTIREGDILFGSFIEDDVRVCVFPKLDVPAIAKADCFCVHVKAEAIEPEYLALQLATTRTHDSLLEEVHGATRPRITTKQLKKIVVPVCSPEEQRAIVTVVKLHFALADSIEHHVEAATAKAEKLPQAILSKAFSGELVPTEAELARAMGRPYETAGQLLARVSRDATESDESGGRSKEPGRRRGATKRVA